MILVNNSTVVNADILASNGVVQVIDTVLVPPDLFLPDLGTPTLTPAPTPESGSFAMLSTTAFVATFVAWMIL
jgi:hypothetical protein